MPENWGEKIARLLEFLEAKAKAKPIQKKQRVNPLAAMRVDKLDEPDLSGLCEEPDKFVEQRAVEELNFIEEKLRQFMESIDGLALTPQVREKTNDIHQICNIMRATVTGLLSEAAKQEKNKEKLQEIEAKKAQLFSEIYMYYKNKNDGGKS